MKKIQFLSLIAGLVLGSMAFTACSSSDDSSAADGGGNAAPASVTPAKPINPANMKPAALTGFVFDKDGKALSGVTVTSGTQSVTTDINGGFIFKTVNTINGRTVVRFSKPNYVDVVRSSKQENGDAWEVVMAKANDESSSFTTQQNFSALNGTNLNVQGMKVDMEANGFVNEATGLAPAGLVKVDMVYLDPGNKDFSDLMPGGDLAAEQVNNQGEKEEVQLISYGMTAVNMTEISNGNKVQLKGKKAKVTFPVPESMQNDEHIGDPIPLWSFDEEKGLWVKEGMATYNSDNNVYEGEVSHFSWANLDYPEKRATIKVTVVDDTEAHKPIPGVKVTIGQVTKTTKKDGTAETYVPINTAFTVTVLSEDYANYTNIQKVDIAKDELVKGEVKEITITLQTLAHISGTINNEGSGDKMATVWIEYNGKSTKKVHSDIDGQFYLNAPADYQGDAKLKVRCTDGTTYTQDIKLNGKDQAFNITIKNDVTSGGAVKAIMNDGSNEYNYTIDNLKLEDFQGVCLVDGTLEIIPSHGHKGEEDAEGWNNLYVTIDNYKADVSDYENIGFNFEHEGPGGYFSISTGYNNDTKNNKVNVTRKGDAFRFKLSGDAFVNGEGIQGGNLPNATMEADFTISYLMTAVSKLTFDANDFPSFTPTLADQSLVYCAIITDSPVMSKGGYLTYGSSDITFDDFLSLKAKADAYFGKDNMLQTSEFDADDEGAYDVYRILYAKDNKYLEISYCNWCSWEDHSNYKTSRSNFFMNWNPDGRIDIRAYEGLKIPYSTFSDALRFRVKKK